MKYLELFERYDLEAWGYWITPEGKLLKVMNSHGHDTVLHKALGKEMPRKDNGRIDIDKTYWTGLEARKNGWIWLRTGNVDNYGRDELSVAFTTPTKSALRKLQSLFTSFKDYERYFIDAWNQNAFADNLMDFKANIRKLV